jgi:O-antigen/teichoic acid export membrane protein
MLPVLTRAPLTLRANLAWGAVGNLVYLVSQFCMLLALARLGSPEMVGQFALGLAITAPVFLLANLRLRTVLATDAAQRFSFRDYLIVRCVSSVAAIAIVAAIVTVAEYKPQTKVVVLVIAVAKTIESLSELIYGALQQKERMDRVAISMSLRGISSFILLVVAVKATGSVVWGASAIGAAWLAILLLYDLSYPAMVNSSDAGRNTIARWQLLRLTFPLGCAAMLGSLYVNIPRYFIESHGGEHQLGIFAALYSLGIAGNALIGSIGESASARLAAYYESGQLRAYLRLLGKLILLVSAVGISGVVIAVVAGVQLLKLLYGAAYAEHSELLILLLLAGAISYVASLLNYGMIAAKYFRTHMALILTVTAVVTAACAWLVPQKGMYGAALAMLLGMAVQTLGGIAVLVLASIRVPITERQQPPA